MVGQVLSASVDKQVAAASILRSCPPRNRVPHRLQPHRWWNQRTKPTYRRFRGTSIFQGRLAIATRCMIFVMRRAFWPTSSRGCSRKSVRRLRAFISPISNVELPGGTRGRCRRGSLLCFAPMDGQKSNCIRTSVTPILSRGRRSFRRATPTELIIAKGELPSTLSGIAKTRHLIVIFLHFERFTKWAPSVSVC